MKSMTTWTNYPASGAAVTTWSYDSQRGWLTNKGYASPQTGAARTNGPVYTHTLGGKLATRTWERGVKAAYVYNQAGDLETVTYSSDPQNTPGIAYTYNRLGQQATATQGGSVVSLNYLPTGASLGERYSGTSPLAGLAVTNYLDHLLRRTNVSVLNAQMAVLAKATNSFDSAGRLATVGDGTTSATYSYLANSPLVEQIAFANNGGAIMTTKKTYDSLNRLTSIQSLNPQLSTLNSFAYDYNSANQRTLRREADGSYWRYEFDSLGQVKSGKKYWSDGTPVAGQQFQYAFDTIGNRTGTKAGGDENGTSLRTAAYIPDLLNRYASRTNVGAVDVMGVALATNTVTVNSATTYRKGEYFRKQLAVDNSTVPIWLQVDVAAVNEPTVTRHEFVPPAQEVFTYDLDGNLTQDSRWNYTWDAENRLVRMEARSGAWPQHWLAFVYDWRGRRIAKSIGPVGSGTATNTVRFVYDGWNLISTLNSQPSTPSCGAWT